MEYSQTDESYFCTQRIWRIGAKAQYVHVLLQSADERGGEIFKSCNICINMTEVTVVTLACAIVLHWIFALCAFNL